MKDQKNFLEVVENSKIFFADKFFKNQKNFLAWPEVVWQNFLAGTEALNKLIVGDELYEKPKKVRQNLQKEGYAYKKTAPKAGAEKKTQTK